MSKDPVPYIVYESSETKSDRIIHRLIVAVIICVLLLVMTNAIWIFAWINNEQGTQIETSNGTTNYIGNDGEITSGNQP